ncbi:protein Hook homolog 2-like [Numida meleagris]|uniref:protein Hook homolog 2-like n=1 Tax=Numida meleagris TaxID=8996 RepID=UPI000B3E0EA7|nr:protein Hook homolog 2-like [Numida meleagris]
MAAGSECCRPLLPWLQTFDPPSPCTSPQDLTTGVTLAHVLHCIDSSWFNETWLGCIQSGAEDNWRLKASNLQKVLQSVLEYWQDVLGQAVAERHVPDVVLAAQCADPEQLGKLVRLVLGCAVSCERREEHIQRIMTLDEAVQHGVMTVCQPDGVGVWSQQWAGPGGQWAGPGGAGSSGRGESNRTWAGPARRGRGQDGPHPQVEELSGQQAAAALQAERWQRECRSLQERFEALSQERERLLEERDALREANEELRCAQVQQSCLQQADAVMDGSTAPAGNLAAEILPAELRETVARLQQENQRLQAQEAALRLQRDRLQRQLRDIDRLEAVRAVGLQGDPNKEVMRAVEPPHTAPVLRALRNQLQEKDALIRHLENDYERSRAQQEREERLLVTAWYNMGLALQQQTREEGALGTPPRSGPRSFLAQQRLATAARRARPPHGRPPNR